MIGLMAIIENFGLQFSLKLKYSEIYLKKLP